MIPALRTVSRCLVCGFTEIRTDEVVDRGLVLLAECPRCEHRWTVAIGPPAPARPGPVARVRALAGSGAEGAHAA